MKTPNIQKRALILCFTSYALIYTGRLNMSVASPLLQKCDLLNKEQIGILGSTFFFVYAIGRILNGIIGDKTAPKPFLALGLLLSAICNLCFSFLPSSGWMYLLWGLNGLFQSMLWGAALRCVSSTSPDDMVAKRSAIVLSTSVGVGTVLGIVLPTLLAQIGVRQVFLIPGLLILIMSLLLFLLLPSSPTPKTKKSSTLNFSCLHDRVLLKMLLPAMAHGAIKENLTLWIPLLFMEMYKLDLSHASFYIFLMPVATLLGRLVFPFWYRCCKKRDRWTLATAFLACALALIPFLFAVPPAWLSGILLAIVAIMTSIINAELVSVYPINFQAVNQVSTVSGILDCATYIGSALGSVVFGYLILAHGYISMIIIWGVLSVCSILLLLFKATNKKNKDNQI